MARHDANETPPEIRWWARIDDECPITLEPINTMTSAPFFLYAHTSTWTACAAT